MIENSAQRIAQLAAQAADDKKAEDVQVLRMPEVMVDTAYFVICSASTQVQIRAIVNSITDALEEAGVELVHVFLEEERHYYDLEKLWADAKRVPWA